VDSLEGGGQGVFEVSAENKARAYLKMNHGQESWLKQKADIRGEC